MTTQNPIILAPDSGLMPGTVLMLVLIVGVPLYFLLRFLRAYERRGRPLPGNTEADARVAALEAQVERLTEQVEQLTDAQQFTAQLLQRPARSDQKELRNSEPPQAPLQANRPPE